jgi:hypothetical protein
MNKIVDFSWLIPQHVATRVGIASHKIQERIPHRGRPIASNDTALSG